MNVKLVVVQGKPEGKEIPLKDSRFLIGRGAECHLRPNSELISRHHSLFTVDNGELHLRDLGSTNGTLVNGKRIQQEVVINHGDLVQVGPLGFKVILDPVPSPVVGPESKAVAASPAPAVPASVPPPVTKVGKLGSRDASQSDIAQWLVGDSKNPVPDSGSGVYSGDTQLYKTGTTVDQARDAETKTDLSIPPEALKPPEENVDRIVEGEGGIKIKLSAAKQKIEKTREDTSAAAADILRRMMNRRPKGRS